MEDRRVGRTAKNLLLALINATLILVIICLWFAWKVLSAAQDVSTQISEAAETVAPVRDDINALTEEIAGARADLASLRESAAEEVAPGLVERLDRIEAQLGQVTETIAEVRANPDELIDKAMARAFDELRAIVAEILALRRSGESG